MINEKIIDSFLEDIDFSIISSIDEDGYPVSRAMLPFREREGIKTFYFTTNTSSQKVKQFRNNPKASLYFFDKMKFIGLLIVGEIEVLEDTETKERIWRDGDNIYYSKGVKDTDYCVLKFRAKKFRLYSNFSSEDYII